MTALIVLCGGLGSRLGPTGRTRQKTMHPVAGTPLLEHVLTQACPALPAPAPIRLLTGHRAVDVENAVPGWQQRIDPRIRAVPESEPGAAGVLHLADRLPPPVLIIAGNVLIPYTRLLPLLLAQWTRDRRPIAVGSRQWRTESHHTLTPSGDTVASWHRTPYRDDGAFEVVDSYLITPQVLALMRTGPEPISHTRALAALTPHRAVGFAEFTGDWLHVQTPADLTLTPSRKALLCPPASPSSSSSPDPPAPGRPPSPPSSPSC
ncbi:nucleotidyltransferase family protein [Streptomyces sp. NPDC001889]